MKASKSTSHLKGPFDLPGDERYAEFLVQVTRLGQVWTLKGEGGFIAFSDEEGRFCFPFWPDPASAATVATGEWADCRPEAIALDVFMSRWLQGMAKDGRMAAVFPAPDGSGVVMEPEGLLRDLDEELAQRDL